MPESVSKFDWQFHTFGDPQLTKMLEAAQEFCRNMKVANDPYWISLLGTSGAGKTHLARRITRYFHDHCSSYIEKKTEARLGRRGGFKSWRYAVQDLRNGDYSGFRDLCEDWFVCIDDIGAEQGTDFIISKLDELFDARQKRWTVITANLSLKDIHDSMSARIASRMLRNNSVVIDVDVIDFSLRANQGAQPSRVKLPRPQEIKNLDLVK